LTLRGLFHFRSLIRAIILPLLLLSFCLPASGVFALSIEDEREMGQKFMAQIRKHFELVDDDFANQFFNDLGRYLITPLETKPFPFHFYIIKGNDLNAFAGPGGHIFIFSGLIEALDSIDELASVVCHEIAHVSARHISSRMGQATKIGIATLAGILAGVLIGGKAAQALIMGTQAAAIQTQLGYSRTDERQADQLGFTYMKAAGYDPGGMISMLGKLQKGHWGADKIPPYLLTHPAGPERMANLDSLMTDYRPGKPKMEAARFKTLFPFFKTIIRATCLDTHEAETLFELELKKNPDASSAHLGLGIIYKQKSEYEMAIHHLKKAKEESPGFLPVLINLGEAYQMNGQDREAIRVLEDALRLDGRERPTQFLLGLSYENLEQYQKAIYIFERLASYEPVKDEVYYHLGISYGRMKRLALAHYNFGVYFKKLNRMRKAEFHFRKAEEYAGNNSPLKRKIREAEEAAQKSNGRRR